MANPNIPNDDQMFQSIKATLGTIIRYKSDATIIGNYVKVMHQIMVHTYQFMKLYILHSYESNLAIGNNVRINRSIINKDFIENVAKVICEPGNVLFYIILYYNLNLTFIT